MFEFIDSINNILKIGNCDDGCQFKTFCLLLKNCFEKNILLNEKKIFFIGQCLAYGQIFELLCKVSFEILLAKIKNLPDSYFYFQKTEIFAFKMIQVLFRLDLKIFRLPSPDHWFASRVNRSGFFFILVKVNLVPRILPLFDRSFFAGRVTFIRDFCCNR